MGKNLRISGPLVIKTVVRIYESYTEEQKELLFSKLFEDMSEEEATGLLNFVNDPKRTSVYDLSLGQLVEVFGHNLNHYAKQSLRKVYPDFDDQKSYQGWIRDIKFDDGIGFHIEFIGLPAEELHQVSYYYVQKIDII